MVAIDYYSRLVVDNLGMIIAMLSLFVAIMLLYFNIKALNEANRPHVSFFMRSGRTYKEIRWVLHNSGNRPAQNISVKLDPPLVSYLHKWFVTSQNEYKLHNISVDYLAAGQEVYNIFDYALHRYSKNNTDDIIEKSLITISYSFCKRKFQTKYTIDLSYFHELEAINEPYPIKDSVKRIADALEQLIQTK